MPLVSKNLKRLDLCGLRSAFPWLILLWAIFPSAHSQEIPAGFNVERYASLWERNPFTLAKAAAPQVQPSAFEKLYLASWLMDGGKEVVWVENSETKEGQRIAAEPNQNNMRLIEMHLNLNPRLVEAVISDGNEKGTIKFRFDGQPPPGPTTSLAQAPSANAADARTPVSQESVPVDRAPASRIYPGVPRVHLEGGPRRPTPQPELPKWKLRRNSSAPQ